MKRYLLILFVIISLSVSCSSTQVKQPETPAEPPVAEAPAAQEKAPEAEEAKEPESTSEEIPVSGAPAEGEDAVAEEAASETQPLEEQEVTEELPAEAEEQEVQGEEETAIDVQDWSQVIGTAPAEQAPEVQSEPEKAPETPVEEPKKEAPEAEKAPAQQPAQTPARKASFTDKIISIVKTVGNFVSDQILLSIGIFVCVGGFVYLIAALAISGRREREKRATRVRKTPKENTSFEPGQDKDPESDDDFLKSLLGDDSN